MKSAHVIIVVCRNKHVVVEVVGLVIGSYIDLRTSYHSVHLQDPRPIQVFLLISWAQQAGKGNKKKKKATENSIFLLAIGP